MAKLKTTEPEEAAVISENAPAPTVEDNVRQETVAQALKSTKPDTTPSPFVTRILKAFRAYPELYIDTLGSTYTPETPEKLRLGAALYKNPFYEP